MRSLLGCGAGLRRRFQEVPDRREASGTKYSMTDTRMSAFAMFSLALFSLKGSSILRRWPFKFVRGGRSRWRIENETFNTLKDQEKNSRAVGRCGTIFAATFGTLCSDRSAPKIALHFSSPLRNSVE